MPPKTPSIPVNPMAPEPGVGIVLDRLVVADLQALSLAGPGDVAQATYAHREDRHAFFLLETGTIHLELDFQECHLQAPALVYVHPDQVHRILSFSQLTVSTLGMTTEQLQPQYRPLLAALVPAKPLSLTPESFGLLADTMALCARFAARHRDQLTHALLHDSCNALVALVLSQYLPQAPPAGKLARSEVLTQAFKELLERQYPTTKRPSDYAHQLHVSTPYLNECVKAVTGHPVSYAIQQRVLLEAKRLLYHSEQSVKEIATALGYVDYPYFARLFAKGTGMTALAFRRTRRD
jgi:AraC family transcriptional activator of pobA